MANEPDRGFDFEVTTYPKLAMQPRRKATYIFADLDRLPAVGLAKAAGWYRDLKSQGCRVLNDPARFLSRYGLLRALFRTGSNSFNAYFAEERVMPRRWPVFLRMQGDHGYPSGLLESPEQLRRAINRAVGHGVPFANLLIIEYAGEPVKPGLFRKLSVFRVGGLHLGYTCVHQAQWVVKYGTEGIADEELYEDEFRLVRDNPFGAQLAKVFRTAGLEYGRADFAIVKGRLEVYEINSNPDLKLRPKLHPSSLRNRSVELFRERYLEAMSVLDTG